MAAMWAKTLLLSAGIASFLSSSSSRSANGLSDGSEYDFTILDPESPHGSPYGGFSRATASRLASLPLKLPPVGDKLNEFEPFYFQVRDALGRPFSCRAYHEDELDARTLTDGMFEPPVLRADPDRVEDNNKEIMDSSVPTVDEKDHESIVLNSKEDLDRKLAPLQGMCAQFHQGWWSYEWCYEGKVTQFHVEVKDLGRRSQMLTVGDVTSLGEFRERKVANTGSSSVNDHSGGRRGTTKKVDNADKVNAVEVFTDGDVCTETGKPRETTALLMCCSAAHTKKSRGTVVYNGEPFETDLVSLQSVTESKQKICTYTITVCTPLLCDDQAKQKPDRTAMSPSGSPTSISEELENMSVSEILDSVFGGKRSKCIQFGTGAWWVYELCPGKLIRQFHEVTLLDRVSGLTSTAVETEHILGRFDKESRLPKDREWEHVVNVTALHTASSTKTKGRSRTVLVAHGGNGAYYYQEYIGGDVCDHMDVTGSAIKAGEVGEGLIERSTTVKYGCGNHVEMTVKEDTTCHYVATVSLPALCHHPLFRPPLSKKQVIKCVPEFDE